MLLHLIADFGPRDLAFAEVAQRLKLYLPEAELILTSVPPFATLAAGFCAAQLALNEAPPGTVVFHNVAPRRDAAGAQRDNDGERLAYARLPGGVRSSASTPGTRFRFSVTRRASWRSSTLRRRGRSFARATFSPGRARRSFAPKRARWPKGSGARRFPTSRRASSPTSTASATSRRRCAPPPRRRAAPSRSPSVRTRARWWWPTAASAWRRGSFCLAPGSSGWQDRNGRVVRWLELFLRGGSAFEAFGRPALGAALELG